MRQRGDGALPKNAKLQEPLCAWSEPWSRRTQHDFKCLVEAGFSNMFYHLRIFTGAVALSKRLLNYGDFRILQAKV